MADRLLPWTRFGRSVLLGILGWVMILGAGMPQVRGQSAFAGNYSGNIFIQLSGLFSVPESAIGGVLVTVDTAGAVRIGLNVTTGTSVGTVEASGRVRFAPPLGSQIVEGVISDGTLMGTNTVNNSGLISRYRVFAPRIGSVVARPVITAPLPSAITTNIGTQLLLSVPVTGDDLAMQWFFGAVGNTSAPIPGATTNQYLTPPILGISNYWFRATNSSGSVQSGTRITVTGTLTRPLFTVHPVAQTALVGAPVTFVSATIGTQPVLYQWRKNNVDIPGGTNASFLIPSVATTDAATYTVFASNIVGTAVSTGAVLTVRVPGQPEFTKLLPPTKSVGAGGLLSLEVEVTGDPVPSLQWYQRSSLLAGATNRVFQITNITANRGGLYQVVASNIHGRTTNSTTVSVVQPPAIGTQPEEVRVQVGQQWSIAPRSFVGSSPDTFQWYRNDQAIPGATNQQYQKIAELSDTGTYYVQIANIGGTTNSVSVPVVVLTGPVPPYILTQPVAGVNVEENGFFTLSVRAAGEQPVYYEWWNGNTVVAAGPFQNVLSSNLVSLAATGAYRVVITNIAGAITSSVSSILVYPKQASPVLTPFTYTTNRSAGDSVTLEFAVQQGDFLNFQWYRRTLGGSGNIDTLIPGATGRTLTLTGLTAGSAGTYALSATNFKGNFTATVILNVAAPPEFTLQPESQEVAVGSFVLLSSTAGPFTTPIGYQWFRNGALVPGATQPTLQFAASAGSAGTYYVVASNVAGVTRSREVQVVLGVVKPSTRTWTLVADKTVAIPERAGFTFGNVINGSLRSGVVTFFGNTNFPDIGGHYRFEAGAITRMADLTTSLPGVGTTPSFFNDTSREDAGAVALGIRTSVEDSHVYDWRGGVLTRIAGAGMPIPGKGGVTFRSMGSPEKAGGRVAFLATLPPGTAGVDPRGYRGVFVWDGSSVSRWADSDAPLPAGDGYWQGNSSQVGFDGNLLAFWAVDQQTNNGIFVATATGPVRKIAFHGDPIPGTSTNFHGFLSPPRVHEGRVLFLGHTGYFADNYLCEWTEATGLRVIARATDVVPGLPGPFNTLAFDFAHATGGDILFSAFGPGQRQGIYRWSKGTLSEELSTMNSIGGRQITSVALQDVDGDDCLIRASFDNRTFGLYVALGNTPVVTRPSLSVQRTATGMTLSWPGPGRLESSGDLGQWTEAAATSPATIEFNPTGNRFFRIRVP